jgi:hypothetical protein
VRQNVTLGLSGTCGLVGVKIVVRSLKDYRNVNLEQCLLYWVGFLTNRTLICLILAFALVKAFKKLSSLTSAARARFLFVGRLQIAGCLPR